MKMLIVLIALIGLSGCAAVSRTGAGPALPSGSQGALLGGLIGTSAGLLIEKHSGVLIGSAIAGSAIGYLIEYSKEGSNEREIRGEN